MKVFVFQFVVGTKSTNTFLQRHKTHEARHKSTRKRAEQNFFSKQYLPALCLCGKKESQLTGWQTGRKRVLHGDYEGKHPLFSFPNEIEFNYQLLLCNLLQTKNQNV